MGQGERRRSRRAVLVGLALFALVQVVLAPAVLRWGLCLRDPGYGHQVSRLKQRLAERPRPLLVVQVGSSRTLFGLRGQVAEPALSERLGRPIVLFNMGLTGAGPITNLLNLRRLLNEGIRPDLLLIEVLPLSLTEEPVIAEVLPERLPVSRLNSDEMHLLARCAGADRPGVEREWWLAQTLPVHAYRFALVALAAPNLLPPSRRWDLNPLDNTDASGWFELRSLSPERVRLFRAAEKTAYAPPLRAFRLSQRKLAVVRQTIDLARRSGVAPALVLMPEGGFFRCLYPSAVREQIHEALTRLSQDCGVPLLDLRNCVADDGFLDAHHLYPEGAARYTRRLAEHVEVLLRPGISHPDRPEASNLVSPFSPGRRVRFWLESF
jgi:hypothetical protein